MSHGEDGVGGDGGGPDVGRVPHRGRHLLGACPLPGGPRQCPLMVQPRMAVVRRLIHVGWVPLTVSAVAFGALVALVVA